MRVELDPSFSGESGMLKVWNETSGAVQVTADGHLLDGKTSAWVTENDVLLELAEIGQVVIISGFDSTSTTPVATPKKSGKKPKTVEEPSEPSDTDSAPVAHDEPSSEPTTETVVSEEPKAN